MNEQQCLERMVPPGQRRGNKLGGLGGVMQINISPTCDKACFNCTQGSQYARRPNFMTPEQLGKALKSLEGYFGVVALFGGNPAIHPQFHQMCDVLAMHVPRHRRGIWCNNPITLEKARKMRATFNPAVSNLNVHLDRKAYGLFREGWPESHVVGLNDDSRHSPPFVAMRDVVENEAERWDLISRCPINQHWSAMIGVFRGELRAWFCEIAGAQSMLHQDDPDYPDTGFDVTQPMPMKWWEMGMPDFAPQVRKHCHECGIPLQGYGELSQAPDDVGVEQTSVTHQDVCKPKRKNRTVAVVQELVQLNVGRLQNMTRYLQNAKV